MDLIVIAIGRAVNNLQSISLNKNKLIMTEFLTYIIPAVSLLACQCCRKWCRTTIDTNDVWVEYIYAPVGLEELTKRLFCVSCVVMN